MQTLAAGARTRDNAGESDLPSRQATGALPESLRALLSAGATESDAAWEEFIAEFSFLLLHAARRLARDRDEGMDLYAHLLEVLRAENCQRLRAYAIHPDSKFTTWLVVVARRICLDRHRAKYGRQRGMPSERQSERRAVRRNLEGMLSVAEDPAILPADSSYQPDADLRAAEIRAALAAALDKLPPADRLLLKLRFTDDVPVAEIAALLHMPSQFHVYRRLKTVLRALRSELVLHGVDDAVV